MATIDLLFSKNPANRDEASFVSEGVTTIQMKRAKEGSISIYANLDGMEKKYIGGYGAYKNGDYKNMVFTVDVLPGMTVTIESSSEVVSAKMLTGDILRSAKEYTDDRIAEIVNGSPEALDTLKELSDALGADPNFTATIAKKIGEKIDKTEVEKILSNYILTEMEGTGGGRALVFNESDGGGAKFEGAEVDAFAGVNDGMNGVYSLMYAKTKTGGNGPRVFLTKDKAYYKVGTDYSVTDDKEIATKGNLNELREKVNELEEKLSMLQNSLQSPLIG